MGKDAFQSVLDQSRSKLTPVTQKFVIDCLSVLAGALDILKEKLILENSEIILVGRSTEKRHSWLSQHYSLFCGRKKIKQDYFSKPTIRGALLKKTK